VICGVATSMMVPQWGKDWDLGDKMTTNFKAQTSPHNASQPPPDYLWKDPKLGSGNRSRLEGLCVEKGEANKK